MHYIVRINLDRGQYLDTVFFTLDEANEYYQHITRIYKALISKTMDGMETKLAEYNGWKHQRFDYTGPIIDIKSIPNKRVKVSGDDAWVYFINSVYQYKKRHGLWELVAVYGTESEYEPAV